MTMQETTAEFARRLQQAVDGHPLAPPTPHGRQKWLRDKLEREAGLDVSANTIHKWMGGAARPRPDNIRLIARVLSVDEVWLALGRLPTASVKEREVIASQANGATLVVAGLIEMSGGRVAFIQGEESPAQITVNLAGKQFDAIVVTPQRGNGEKLSFIIPEPVQSARIVAVISETGVAGCPLSAGLSLLDLTHAERKTLGGFSIIEVERRKGNKFKIGEARTLTPPLASVQEIAA